jgi:hypothetical protein
MADQPGFLVPLYPLSVPRLSPQEIAHFPILHALALQLNLGLDSFMDVVPKEKDVGPAN